jgi:hypothetical protein
MAMRFRLIISLLVTAAAMLGVGCNNDEKSIESQRTYIERYLTSSHNPRLIAKEDIENSPEYNPAFYERFGMDTYRYIATYYDSGRNERTEVMMGSEIEIRYTAYKFAGRKPSTSAIYMTNDPEQIAELVEDGLNTDYWPEEPSGEPIIIWSEEPMKIKLGTTKIIKGLEISLLGCREGDIAEVYMTQPASYDNKDMGIVEKSSAIMWEYTILSVKNN